MIDIDPMWGAKGRAPGARRVPGDRVLVPREVLGFPDAEMRLTGVLVSFSSGGMACYVERGAVTGSNGAFCRGREHKDGRSVYFDARDVRAEFGAGGKNSSRKRADVYERARRLCESADAMREDLHRLWRDAGKGRGAGRDVARARADVMSIMVGKPALLKRVGGRGVPERGASNHAGVLRRRS